MKYINHRSIIQKYFPVHLKRNRLKRALKQADLPSGKLLPHTIKLLSIRQSIRHFRKITVMVTLSFLQIQFFHYEFSSKKQTCNLWIQGCPCHSLSSREEWQSILQTQLESEINHISSFNIDNIAWVGCPRKALDYMCDCEFKNLESMTSWFPEQIITVLILVKRTRVLWLYLSFESCNHDWVQIKYQYFYSEFDWKCSYCPSQCLFYCRERGPGRQKGIGREGKRRTKFF